MGLRVLLVEDDAVLADGLQIEPLYGPAEPAAPTVRPDSTGAATTAPDATTAAAEGAGAATNTTAAASNTAASSPTVSEEAVAAALAADKPDPLAPSAKEAAAEREKAKKMSNADYRQMLAEVRQIEQMQAGPAGRRLGPDRTEG